MLWAMTHDKPLLGIGLMLGFCAVAPMGDAVAKLIGETIPLGQAVLVRFAVQVLLLLPLIVYGRRPWRMSGRVLRLTALRTVLHILGIAMMFTALKYLPLADAVAIAFVMPFIMLVLGKYVLDEEVGPRRLIACVVGFLGRLLVVQPAFEQVGWPALLPIGVALNFAAFMLVTRQIAKQTDPIGLQTVSGAMAVAIMVPILWLTQDWGFGPLALVTPSAVEWGLLLAIGALGTLAHLLMTWSLRYAPSATLAPMQYLEIPFATAIGWLVFNDLPNALSALGICVMLAAGLYIVVRERAIAQSLASRPAPLAPAQTAAE